MGRRLRALLAALALAGCATDSPRWQALDSSWPARWEVDRNRLVRNHDEATIVMRSSLFDDDARPPHSPRVVFETPYRFNCRDRTYVLLPSRTYNPVSGWRPLPGFDKVEPLDSAESRRYRPALYRAQASAFAIACAPRVHPRPRPGNRLS
jgi:hypothetical protein